MNNDLRSALWNNLCLLGYRDHLPELKGVTWPDANSPDSAKEVLFQAITRNMDSAQRLMESIFAFLFKEYDGLLFEKYLSSCYPVVDRVVQAKDFRNQVLKLLEQLKKDGELSNTLMIRRSYLDECKGERYEKTLLVLSTCVLKRKLRSVKSTNKTAVSDSPTDATTLKTDISALKQKLQSLKDARMAYHRRVSEIDDQLNNEWETLQQERLAVPEIACASGYFIQKKREFFDKWKAFEHSLKDNQVLANIERIISLNTYLREYCKEQLVLTLPSDLKIEGLVSKDFYASWHRWILNENLDNFPDGNLDLSKLVKLCAFSMSYVVYFLQKSHVEPDTCKFLTLEHSLVTYENEERLIDFMQNSMNYLLNGQGLLEEEARKTVNLKSSLSGIVENMESLISQLEPLHPLSTQKLKLLPELILPALDIKNAIKPDDEPLSQDNIESSTVESKRVSLKPQQVPQKITKNKRVDKVDPKDIIARRVASMMLSEDKENSMNCDEDLYLATLPEKGFNSGKQLRRTPTKSVDYDRSFLFEEEPPFE